MNLSRTFGCLLFVVPSWSQVAGNSDKENLSVIWLRSINFLLVCSVLVVVANPT